MDNIEILSNEQIELLDRYYDCRDQIQISQFYSMEECKAFQSLVKDGYIIGIHTDALPDIVDTSSLYRFQFTQKGIAWIEQY